MDPKQYPVDFITYLTDTLRPPAELYLARDNTEKAGFYVLPITADRFNINGRPASAYKCPIQSKQEKPIKVYQAPFKHLRDITMPKMLDYFKNHPAAKGFFIAEGDLSINEGYTFEDWYNEDGDTQHITWLGYKKILYQKGKIHYIVGNFLIYVPRSQIETLAIEFKKQTREIYSDRFFTKLVQQGKAVVFDKPIAGEIEHISAVAGGKVRKAQSHLNKLLPAYQEKYS